MLGARTTGGELSGSAGTLLITTGGGGSARAAIKDGTTTLDSAGLGIDCRIGRGRRSHHNRSLVDRPRSGLRHHDTAHGRRRRSRSYRRGWRYRSGRRSRGYNGLNDRRWSFRRGNDRFDDRNCNRSGFLDCRRDFHHRRRSFNGNRSNRRNLDRSRSGLDGWLFLARRGFDHYRSGRWSYDNCRTGGNCRGCRSLDHNRVRRWAGGDCRRRRDNNGRRLAWLRNNFARFGAGGRRRSNSNHRTGGSRSLRRGLGRGCSRGSRLGRRLALPRRLLFLLLGGQDGF